MKRSTTPSCLSRARNLDSDLTEPQSDTDEDSARRRERADDDGDGVEKEPIPFTFPRFKLPSFPRLWWPVAPAYFIQVTATRPR